MSKNNFVEEEEVELEVVSKKEKKKKTSEERGKDRKVVFWVLLFVITITAVFWLKATINGNGFETYDAGNEENQTEEERQKNDEMNGKEGFFVKYDI